MSNSNDNYDITNAVKWLLGHIDVKRFFNNSGNPRSCLCISVSSSLKRKAEILHNFASCLRLNGKRYLTKVLKELYDRPRANLAARVNPCDWRDLRVVPKIHSLDITPHSNFQAVEWKLRIIGSVSPEDFDKCCRYLHIKMDNELGNSGGCDLRDRYLKVLQFLQDHRKLLPFEYFSSSQAPSLPPLKDSKRSRSKLCKKCNRFKTATFRRKSRTICYVQKEYHRGFLTAEKILLEDYAEESEQFSRVQSSTSFRRAPLTCADVTADRQMEDRILSDIKKRIDHDIQQNLGAANFAKYPVEKREATADVVSFHEEEVQAEVSDPRENAVESVFAGAAPAQAVDQCVMPPTADRSNVAIDDVDQVIEKIIDNLVICEEKVRARARARGVVLDALSSPRDWCQEKVTDLLRSCDLVSSDEDDDILTTDTTSPASSVDSETDAKSSASLKSPQRPRKI